MPPPPPPPPSALLLRLQLLPAELTCFTSTTPPFALKNNITYAPSVFALLRHAPLRALALPRSMVSRGTAQPACPAIIAVVRHRRLGVDASVHATNLPSLYYCNTFSGTAGSPRTCLGHKTGTAPQQHSRAKRVYAAIYTDYQVLSWVLCRCRCSLRQLPMHRALVVGLRLSRHIFSLHDVVVAVCKRCLDVRSLPFPH
jgi:hypothetical protein